MHLRRGICQVLAAGQVFLPLLPSSSRPVSAAPGSAPRRDVTHRASMEVTCTLEREPRTCDHANVRSRMPQGEKDPLLGRKEKSSSSEATRVQSVCAFFPVICNPAATQKLSITAPYYEGASSSHVRIGPAHQGSTCPAPTRPRSFSIPGNRRWDLGPGCRPSPLCAVRNYLRILLLLEEANATSIWVVIQASSRQGRPDEKRCNRIIKGGDRRLVGQSENPTARNPSHP